MRSVQQLSTERTRIEKRFPALFTGYSMTPDAIWDHGHQLNLTAADRLVIGALWRHQSRSGIRAHPSRRLLAQETSLGERTVQRTLDDLESRELLAVAHSHGRRTNEYDIAPILQRLCDLLPEPGHGGRVGDEPGHGNPEPGHGGRVNPAMVAAEVKKPRREKKENGPFFSSYLERAMRSGSVRTAGERQQTLHEAARSFSADHGNMPSNEQLRKAKLVLDEASPRVKRQPGGYDQEAAEAALMRMARAANE